MLKLISQKSLVLATETYLLVFFVLYGRNLWVFNQLKKQISIEVLPDGGENKDNNWTLAQKGNLISLTVWTE